MATQRAEVAAGMFGCLYLDENRRNTIATFSVVKIEVITATDRANHGEIVHYWR